MSAYSASVPVSISGKLESALGKPIPQRCSLLQTIIEELSTKELHSIYPQLLEHIFGFNSQIGWGLHHIHKHAYGFGHDYTALRNFLSPCGPLFKLVYKLQADDYLRYEFPISSLPTPTKTRFEDKTMSGMYHRQTISLHAFEFYMFHFAYFLVNPQTNKSGPWTNPNDVVYFTLLEDYLEHFLPLGSRDVPPMPAFASPVRSPIAHQTSSMHRNSPASPSNLPPTTPPRQYLGLLKSPGQPTRNQSPHSPVATDNKEHETWRSESFIQVMVEFWLNQHLVEADSAQFTGSPSHRRQGRCSPKWSETMWGTPPPVMQPFHPLLYDSALPTIDHVRAVRMIIKHFHFFVNSSHLLHRDMSSYQQLVLSPLEQLRRILWPGFVQKKLYAFLKYGFGKWPLDSSFRMMLETWLSFIQPWRYIEPGSSHDDHHDAQDMSREGAVDSRWDGFITENLLFYSTLLQDFLNRASRMDLGSAKNAYMLFRVTKVFCVPNLVDIIKQAEPSSYQPQPISPRRPSQMDLGGSYLSSSMSSFSSPSSMLSLQFADLEGPGFQYRPLFSEETKVRVEQLLSMLTQAKSTVANGNRLADGASSGILKWLGLGPMIDYNAQRHSSYYGEDYTPTDSKKLLAHLDQSASKLCKFFGINTWQVDNQGWAAQYGFGSSSTSSAKNLPPDHVITDVGPRLTPLGRDQVMNRVRSFDVRYAGDPELLPVYSYESTLLVRMLYDLASFINYKLGPKIEDLYYHEGFIGHAARQVFLPPLQNVTSPPRCKTTSPRIPQTKEQLELARKPRLSLRFLASYRNLAMFFIFFIIMRLLFGLGPVGFILFVGFMYMSYVTIRALTATGIADT